MSLENFNAYVWQRIPELAIERYKALEPQILSIWTKEATWPRRLFEISQLLPATTPLPGGIPSHPSPLLGALVGGLAGAGLGYGAGVLAEKALPKTWQKGRLRNTLAVLGGGLGATPGLGMAAFNVAGGKPINSMESFERSGYDPQEAQRASKSYLRQYQPWLKLSANAGLDSAFSFNADDFNEMIWADPRINHTLDMPTQAAASGLVTGAANLPGKRPGLVTPLDVARIAAGMGSGYLSGLVVGKTLGVMMGLPDTTQEKLKNTGMWAGVIQSIIPIAFGG